MMRSPRRRQGTAMDRVLAMLFVAFFLYLLWLAMTGQIDDQVNRLAAFLRRSFS